MAALTASATSATAQPAANSNATPNGVWTNQDREVIVRIAPCAGSTSSFCGTVVRDNRPGPAANPANHILIRDLRGDRQGWRGKINDGGFQLNLTLRLSAPSTAQARYCFGLACETETWSRIGDLREAGPSPSR